MPALRIAKAEEIGFDPAGIRRVNELLERLVATDQIPAAGVCIGRKGKIVEPIFVGKLRPDAESPLRNDALFLVASLTKPVTVSAVMLLVERGFVALDDRVAEYVPKFAANRKQDVRI